MIEPLKLDQHPELREMVFGNYTKIVYLAQTEDAELQKKAKWAADYLGLDYEYRFTGYGDLTPAILDRGPVCRDLKAPDSFALSAARKRGPAMNLRILALAALFVMPASIAFADGVVQKLMTAADKAGSRNTARPARRRLRRREAATAAEVAELDALLAKPLLSLPDFDLGGEWQLPHDQSGRIVAARRVRLVQMQRKRRRIGLEARKDQRLATHDRPLL